MAPNTPVKIVLGTHTLGDKENHAGICHFDTEVEVNSVLDAFYERGYRDLDTARLYPGSEVRLGRAKAASRFAVHTKVQSGQPGDHEPAKLHASIEQSLADLRTPIVETMFLHIPDRQTPFEDVAKAMNDAMQQGKFRRFGLSNYSAAEVKHFIDVCEQNGYTKPNVYQGHYNALVRGGEKDLFPLLREHNIAFFAYSPAAGGFFSNKASTTARWSDNNPIGQVYSAIYSHPDLKAAVEKVQELGQKHGIDGHAAALRWTIFHSILDGRYGDAVLFSSSRIEQLTKTMDAVAAGPLPDELADAITAIYATVKDNAPPFHL